MPTIRRRQPRARMIRRKLMGRRYYKKTNPYANRIYNFKRKLFVQDWTIVGATQAAGVRTFALSDLPGYTDFTSLYDMYKIRKVVFKIIPKFSEVALSGGTTNNANLQQIHSAIDYDDGVAPASINTLCQYQSHRMTRGYAVHTRTLVPKVQTTVSGLNTAPKANQWIDCDQAGIVHNGVKYIIPAAAQAGTTLYYDCEITMYLSMKNVL